MQRFVQALADLPEFNRAIVVTGRKEFATENTGMLFLRVHGAPVTKIENLKQTKPGGCPATRFRNNG
jgi:hypothetical protein